MFDIVFSTSNALTNPTCKSDITSNANLDTFNERQNYNIFINI